MVNNSSSDDDDEGPPPLIPRPSFNSSDDDSDVPPLGGRPSSSGNSSSEEESLADDGRGFRPVYSSDESDHEEGEPLPPQMDPVEYVGLMLETLRVANGVAQAETTTSGGNGGRADDDAATSISAVGESTSAFTGNLSSAARANNPNPNVQHISSASRASPNPSTSDGVATGNDTHFQPATHRYINYDETIGKATDQK